MYVLAGNVPYGENSWLSDLFGRHITWLIYGFMFGVASLSWGNAVWCAVVFYILMHFSNIGYNMGNWREWKEEDIWKLDHACLEVAFGVLGTVFYLFR